MHSQWQSVALQRDRRFSRCLLCLLFKDGVEKPLYVIYENRKTSLNNLLFRALSKGKTAWKACYDSFFRSLSQSENDLRKSCQSVCGDTLSTFNNTLLSPYSGRSYSKTLQQAPLSLLPRRHCQEHFHGAFTSRMLCAGSIQPERRVDSCRGDSGGPLVCERLGGGWVVYGVTSWGHACRTQQSPGVYTKVSAFSPWIHKVIGREIRKRRDSERWSTSYSFNENIIYKYHEICELLDILYQTVW